MKSLIDKLAVGKIEYDRPEISLSVAEIRESVEADNVFFGRFNVSSTNGIPMKGVAYSTNARVSVNTEQFSGVTSTIEYEVHTSGAARIVSGNDEDDEANEKIEGYINLVTNGGELAVPFVIDVAEYSVNSSIGKIENYFHFANLVQMNYDEALKLFMSSDFKRLLAKNNYRHLALYDGLIMSSDKRLALEEFLIDINKKKPIILSLSADNKEYEHIDGSYQDAVVISRDSWGYTNIEVKVDGDFLTECRGRITHDEFAGNKYEYTYIIDKTKLYRGVNYGRLTFITHNQTLTYDIKIQNNLFNRTRNKQAEEDLVALSNIYLQFRMHKCTLNDWISGSLDTSNRLIKNGKYRQIATLIKAQVLMCQDKHDEAGWLLDDFIKNQMVNADKNVEMYCYYLYVKSLQKREAAYTAQILDEIRKTYDTECHSWKLLWTILYLDEKYDINKSLKYTLIKSEYSDGCRSPYMYFEALNVLNEQPGLLRILNAFEIQILQFGAKNDWVNEKLISRIVDLVSVEKKYSKPLFETLCKLYDKYPSIELLTAICSLLIRGNKTDKKYFRWYEAGVNAEVRIANIYEYYMLSISDDFEGLLPNMIYMYFVYNCEAIGEKQSLLFSNIILNKKKIPSIYENYSKIIEQYLIGELFKGNMDRKLSVIYSDILKSSLISGDIAKNLPDIAETYELTCETPGVSEVIVIHKEIKDEKVCRIVNGKAYIRIYTEEPIILFCDNFGRRFSSTVEYKIEKLSDMQDYLKLCFATNQDNEYLLLHFAEKYSKYQEDPVESVEMFKNVMKYSNIRPKYKQELTSEIIDFYYKNYKGDELKDYLREIDKKGMDSSTRNKVIEMMINRGMYVEAFDLVSEYGYERLDMRELIHLATRIIGIKDQERDDVLLELATYLYRNGKYTENILSYLSHYFYGTVEEMYKLWQDEFNFVYENHELEEKIIVQTIFTDNIDINLNEVFKSYYRYGIAKNIKTAFYVFMSNHILLRHIDGRKLGESSYVFDYIEKDLMNNFGMPTVCKLMLLIFKADANEMTREQMALYKDIMENMCKYNVCLECYKQYERWFEIPFYLKDKIYVDYRANPKNKVSIGYTIGDKKEESGLLVSQMEQIFPGVFSKNFVLFYGDRVSYYVSESDGKGGEQTTPSRTVVMDDENRYKTDGRFDLLNKVLIERDNGNYQEEKRLADEYLSKQKVAENAFLAV